MTRQQNTPMPLRTHCAQRVQDAIRRKRCLHIDGYFKEDRNGALYFVLETRAGGLQLLNAGALRVDLGALGPLYSLVPVAAGEIRGAVDRYINGDWARARGLVTTLEAVHREAIQPHLLTPRHGYDSVSVILHYITVPGEAAGDPCAGMVNYSPYAPVQARTVLVPDAAPGVDLKLGSAGTGKRGPDPMRDTLRTLGKILGT